MSVHFLSVLRSVICSGMLVLPWYHVWSFDRIAPRHNVLMIIADDLNTDLGCYGHPMVQTPNIDRLAAKGLVFRDAHTQFPQCGPSRNSMMSGLYTAQTGTEENRELLRDQIPNVVTMPQHFMAHGYIATRIGKVYHYDNPGDIGNFGHDDPPSWNWRSTPSGVDKTTLEPSITRISYLRSDVPDSDRLGDQMGWYEDSPGTENQHTDGMVTQEALQQLQQLTDAQSPFFMTVGLFRPHTPFVAPSTYFDLYNPNIIPVPAFSQAQFDALPDVPKYLLRSKSWHNDLPVNLAQLAIQAYYASISFLDSQVGEILDHLDTNQLWDSTIVVFVSDHGYHLGEKGHYMKRSLYDRSTKVPLIIYAPGMQAGGQSTDSLVELVDLYKTLSYLANVSKPPFAAGINQAKLLDQPELELRESAYTQLDDGNGTHSTVRKGKWRFTRYASGAKRKELFDLELDPEESNNLAESGAFIAKVAEMEAVLNQRTAEAAAPHPYPPASTQFPFFGRPFVFPGKLEAECYDWGGEGVSYHDTTPQNEKPDGNKIQTRVHTFRIGEGPDTAATTDAGAGYNIGFIEDGEWLEYTVNVPSGVYNLTARLASSRDNPGLLQVHLDGTLLATLSAEDTGGFQDFVDVVASGITIQNGGKNKVLRLTFQVPEGGTFNLNWIKFDLVETRFSFWRNEFSGWQSTDPLPEENDDNDGASNWVEYIQGTDPTDPTSYPEISYEFDEVTSQIRMTVRRQDVPSDSNPAWWVSTDLNLPWSVLSEPVTHFFREGGFITEQAAFTLSGSKGFLMFRASEIVEP